MSNIDLDLILPVCLLPIFKVQVLKEGASIIPLDEFPTIPSQYFKQDRNLTWPRLLKTTEFELFFLNSIIFLFI